MEQKTVNRIKGWSIVVGVLSLANLATLTVYPLTSTVGLIAAVAIILGLASAYAGIKIADLSFKTVSMIFWAKLVWLAINFLYSLSLRDLNLIRTTILVAQVVIVIFLIWSLRKLPHSAVSASADAQH